MKVAFIGTRGIPAAYGGTEIYVERVSKYLLQCGDSVVVYCERGLVLDPKTELPANLKRVLVPTIPTKYLDNFVRSLLSTIHACFDSTIDVIQFNNSGPSVFAILAKLSGKKTVSALRAIDSKREKWSAPGRAFLRMCDFLALRIPDVTTVNSVFMQNYFKSKYDREAIYIPNGVMIPRANPEPDLIRRWSVAKKKYVLFASRLEPEKGCHVLIDAFVKASQPDDSEFQLVIAGNEGKSQDYRSRLMSKANKRIIFVGHLEGLELDEIYSNAYLFVLPSSIEGMSNSLLAAMSYSLPVIVSDIPENLAVIENAPFSEELGDSPGLSFKTGDSEDLAKKLEQLYSNPSQASLRGFLNQNHVRENFTMQTMLEGTRKVYQELLAKTT